MPRDKEPPAFLFYPDDFLSDDVVDDMTTEAVGAYILLLSRSWREKPPASVPDDDRWLAKKARLTSGRWQKVKTSVLAAFTLGSDGRLHQKRLRSEYDKLCKKYRQYADSGRLGAKARWERHGDANGDAIPPPSGAVDVDIENETDFEEVVNCKRAPPISAEHVKAVWKAHPKSRGLKKAVPYIRAGIRAIGLEALTLAVQRYARERQGKDQQYTVHAWRWFKDESWNDEPDKDAGRVESANVDESRAVRSRENAETRAAIDASNKRLDDWLAGMTENERADIVRRALESMPAFGRGTVGKNPDIRTSATLRAFAKKLIPKA